MDKWLPAGRWEGGSGDGMVAGGRGGPSLDWPEHREEIHPRTEESRLDGEEIPPRKNKEVSDAELYALYQAAKTFEAREEEGRSYTILSDSTAAIKRIRSDETGPGQRFAIAIMEVCDRLASRGNGLTVRWVPSHPGAEGNEVADEWAKMAAEGPRDTVSRYLGKTSFAPLEL